MSESKSIGPKVDKKKAIPALLGVVVVGMVGIFKKRYGTCPCRVLIKKDTWKNPQF